MRQWWNVPGPEGAVPELREVSFPEPASGEVVVRMAAAGVNRGELIGGRQLRSDNPRARPAPAGIEVAGTIESVGQGVSSWSVGDRVMARARACYAELVTVDAAALMPSPTGLSDIEAGAIPNVFVTAHDAIVSAADVGPDDIVVVTAGSSGVGTAAVQIVKRLGATAIATTRAPTKTGALKALGADLVVDTTKPAWADSIIETVGRPTCVIDQVGGELFQPVVASLDVCGRYVSVGRNGGATAEIDLDLLARNRLSLVGVTFRTRTPDEALECSRRFRVEMLPDFDDGTLKPVLDRTFPLDDLPAAHEYMRSDSQLGKIVLVP